MIAAIYARRSADSRDPLTGGVVSSMVRWASEDFREVVDMGR
jgi:hypothetical protein